MRRRLTWPRSLRGQMILLLLAVLVIVQGVSIALFVGERDRAIRIATAKEAASRLLNVARELEVVPGSMQETLLRATESRDLQLSLDTAALARAADAQRLERLTRKVARIVDPPAHRQFEIALGRPDLQAGLPEDHQGDWDGDPYELVLSVSLSDGVWLNARIDIGRPPFQWAWPAFVSIALTVVAVVAVVWLLVRRIAGPMSALAAAAEGLGRGEAV